MNRPGVPSAPVTLKESAEAESLRHQLPETSSSAERNRSYYREDILNRFRTSLAFVIAFILLLAGCSTSSALSQNPSPDESEVEAFFQSGIEAFNRRDLDTFMQQFAPDIEMYTPTGWLRGREAVQARFAATFEQFPAVRMELEALTSRSVGPDTVVTDFLWRVFPMGRGPAFHGVGSGVYVRRDGRWEEVLEHETITRIDEGLPGARP